MPVRVGIAVSIVVLFCSLAIFSFLSSRSLCIESPLIEHLEVVNADANVIVSQCRQRSRADYVDDAEKLVEELNRRMLKIDYSVGQIGIWRSPLKLTIIDSEIPVLTKMETRLIIDRRSFSAGSAFERAIWSFWLSDTMSVEEKTIQSALASVLLYASNGDLEPVSLNDVRATVLTAAFLEGYKQLSNRERMEFLKTFINSLHLLAARFSETPNLGVVVSEISEFTASLSFVKPDEVSSAFHRFLEGVVAYQSHQGWAGKGLNLQQALMDSEISDEALEVIGINANTGSRPMLVTDGEKHRILPSQEILSGAIPTSLTAFRGFWITCDNLTFTRLKNFGIKVSKLFVIGCEPYPPKLKNYLLKDDILDFARDNPKAKFLEVHMNSLKKLHNVDGKPFELLAHPGKQPFFKEVGWMEPVYDKKRSLYRAQSELDVIQYYRP